MAQYSFNYMRSHCVDVFFQYHGIPIHALTYGSLLPELLNEMERNRNLQHQVAQRQLGEEYIVEVELNQAYLQLLRTETERYGEIFNFDVATQWFKNVARLGFYSYDCILNRNDFSVFKLVARPRNNVEIRYDLPAFDELSVLNYYDENVPELFIWQGALIS